MPRKGQRTPMDAPGYQPPPGVILPDCSPIYNAGVRVRLAGRWHRSRAPHVANLWRELARQLAAGTDPEACLVVLIDALMPRTAMLHVRFDWYERASADYLELLNSSSRAARLATAAAPTAYALQSTRAIRAMPAAPTRQ